MQSLKALATNGTHVDTDAPWLFFMACTTGHVTELDVSNSSVFRVAMDWYVKVRYTKQTFITFDNYTFAIIHNTLYVYLKPAFDRGASWKGRAVVLSILGSCQRHYAMSYAKDPRRT
jgi:hypothetical protein